MGLLEGRMETSHLIIGGLVFYAGLAMLLARGMYVYRRRDLE